MTHVVDSESGTVPADPTPAGGPIIARSDRRHFIYRCVLLPLMVLGAGLWFAYDGHIGWPKEAAQFQHFTRQAEDARNKGDNKGEADALEARKAFKDRSAFDIRIQKVLGYALPVLAAVAFVYFYRQQRGQVRLEEDVLYVPGHPPVPLGAIRQIDKSKWDRKGIATLSYELERGGAVAKAGAFRLDDALYEQRPIHQILNHVEKTLVPEEETTGQELPTVEG